MVESARVSNPQVSNDNLKAILVVGGVALFIIGTSIGIYFLVKMEKKNRDGGASDSKNNSTNQPENDLTKPNGLEASTPSKTINPRGFVCRNKAYPLKYGTCHQDVSLLQTYLKKMYQAKLGTSGAGKDGVDGKFGAATRNAAIKHLKKSLFTPKDIIGIKTALKFIPK